MEFGISFFPNVTPAEKSAADYWTEALYLTEVADQLGYHHARTVEHYFHSYGGYSPSPMVFLSAAAARTKRLRLIPGAVLPVFGNPLKIAGEIAMVDAISGGRFECGFARAFLPHEFRRFGISLDESRARFDEGVDQIRRLLEEENVSSDGRFHSFKNVTSLPRPTQQPRPPIWTAAMTTEESFVTAGKRGFWIMSNPILGTTLANLIGIYRDSWRSAGHPGQGRIMIAFMMLCAPTRQQAFDIAREPVNAYFKTLVEAASDWGQGASTKDYPNYDKMIMGLKGETVESQIAKKAAWIGSPKDCIDMIESYNREVGGFDVASLQINTKSLPIETAEASIRLFAREVIPQVRIGAKAA
jgi:alkanesulfonate monooxygenase SsuD/methylene tetrahydromethanopterin reductase-like flavin-dependent oxidoreductase (luciferase family)